MAEEVAKKNKGKHPGGRPLKFGPKTTEKLCKAIRMGVYLESACSYADISFVTFREWIKRGEAGEEPYASFVQEIRKAEQECELRLITQWNAHMPSNWTAIATFLERRWPDRWGRKDRYKIDGNHNVKLEVNYVSDWRNNVSKDGSNESTDSKPDGEEPQS